MEIHAYDGPRGMKPIYMHVRRDIRAALQSLMSEPGVRSCYTLLACRTHAGSIL